MLDFSFLDNVGIIVMTTVEQANFQDYYFLQTALVKVDSLVSASELHGMLCGLICAGATDKGAEWLETILQVMEPRSEELQHFNRDILINIFHRSYQQISGFGFDFQLLLPDDDTAISARARAIGEWSQGFLEGIGFAGHLLNRDSLSKDVADALQRLYDISHIDYATLSMSEEDEPALMEVVEYVRVAVLMVYTELVMKVKEGLYGDQSGVIH